MRPGATLSWRLRHGMHDLCARPRVVAIDLTRSSRTRPGPAGRARRRSRGASCCATARVVMLKHCVACGPREEIVHDDAAAWVASVPRARRGPGRSRRRSPVQAHHLDLPELPGAGRPPTWSCAPARSTSRRTARRCGPSEALVSEDAALLRAAPTPSRAPAPSRSSSRHQVEHGCPTDCGTCDDHEQHTCLPIVEVTDHCNLECPICIVDNQYSQPHASPRRSRASSTRLVANEGQCESIALSGGEPTSHPRHPRAHRHRQPRRDRARRGHHQRPAPRHAIARSPRRSSSAAPTSALQLDGFTADDAREDPRARSLRREGRRRCAMLKELADPDAAHLRRRARRQRAPDRPGGRAAARRGPHPVAQLPAGGLHRPRRRRVRARSDGSPHHPGRHPGASTEQTGGAAAHERLLAAALLAPAVRVAHLPAAPRRRQPPAVRALRRLRASTARCCARRRRWARRPRSTTRCTTSSTTCSRARTRSSAARRS